MLEMVENGASPAVLKVFGVGGGGSNAVNRMIESGLRDVDLWVSNTDLQALESAKCRNRLALGKSTTRGRGAGGDPEVGRLSAEEDVAEIEKIITGTDMLFITAGMGGGTGTGAAPVIARTARDLGILTVGIVTRPFSFEGKQKAARARRGIEALAEHVDTLIAIPNDKLLEIVQPGTTLEEAFLMADDVLLQATRGISDLIMGYGIINLDFADVRTVMRGRGNALLGSGSATGDRRAIEAAEKAVSSPFLEDVSIEGAEAVLINIQGGPTMGFQEAAQAAQFVSDRVGEEADVFWGAVVDPSLGEEMRVTLVATGFPETRAQAAVPARPEERATDRERARGNGRGVEAVGTTTGWPGRAAEGAPVVREVPLAAQEGVRFAPLDGSTSVAPAGRSADVRPEAAAPANGDGVSAAQVDGRDLRSDGHAARGDRDPSDGIAPGSATAAEERRDGARALPPRTRAATESPASRESQRPVKDRPAGGRLPERDPRGSGRPLAAAAAGLDAELFLPKDREANSDPGLRRSRWASADPEWTEGDELDRASAKKRPLDAPAYLRRRMD